HAVVVLSRISFAPSSCRVTNLASLLNAWTGPIRSSFALFRGGSVVMARVTRRPFALLIFGNFPLARLVFPERAGQLLRRARSDGPWVCRECRYARGHRGRRSEHLVDGGIDGDAGCG